MHYARIALLALVGSVVALPQDFNAASAGYTKRDETVDVYRRYDSDELDASLLARSLWDEIEARGLDEEDLLFERSDEDLFDATAFLYARAGASSSAKPKPAVPPKPAHLKSPSTKPASSGSSKAPASSPAKPAQGKSSGTDWTKKVQDDAKKANSPKWYNKLGIGHKDKGKKDSSNPVPHLEKMASKQAHKITGYTRKESDTTDKKNNKARIKNQKEEEINKAKANKLTNHNSDFRWFNTGKDVITTGTSVATASHTLGLLKRELRAREAYALYLGLDLDEDLY